MIWKTINLHLGACAHVYLLCALATSIAGLAQENKSLPDKVHHAEPLYNDLVRDLGARKGEKDRQTILSVLRSIRKFLPMR
ncbi:hypothetical protein [Sphingobacterium multivorum]|uniref:hypothetical protein n=1 Tax=Sphingobacterium multivorum TaxID=28454 RepID=UPI0028A8A726|nr:hypothetical protein [Sphingobacterium multivorum]